MYRNINLACLLLRTQLGRSIGNQLRQPFTASIITVLKSFIQGDKPLAELMGGCRAQPTAGDELTTRRLQANSINVCMARLDDGNNSSAERHNTDYSAIYQSFDRRPRAAGPVTLLQFCEARLCPTDLFSSVRVCLFSPSVNTQEFRDNGHTVRCRRSLNGNYASEVCSKANRKFV